MEEHPHRRFNPLTREWVLVSAQRTQRPWLGQIEEVASENLPSYDSTCYLCPGNERVGGAMNPAYTNTFVFDNDFASLKPDTPEVSINHGDLLIAESEAGLCRVICFSPRHDLTLAQMGTADIRLVIDTWVNQYKELGNLPFINSVQIFENRGSMMGCSNPHPHCQVWASRSIPNELLKELNAQKDYFTQHQSSLLADYLKLELKAGERLVYENDHFVALVPFWAVWPFETMLISRRHVTALDQLSYEERDSLADILQQITIRYDNLFKVSFPYTMGFHQRPTDGKAHPEFHLHAHFYPPLLRAATIRKFMVGFEMLATPQRDITPELAAARLREML